MNPICPTPSALRAAAAAFLLIPALLSAQTTWNTTPADNWWSTSANWTPATAPGLDNTALLGSTDTNRTVIYDDAASGALSALTLTQTNAFTNTLELRRDLTLARALTLSAINGGTSRLLINTAGIADAANRFAGINSLAGGTALLNASAGITLGAGGLLEFARKADANAGSLDYVNGPLVINGGTLAIQRATKPSSGGPSSFFYQINGSLTLTSGNLALVTASTNTDAGYTQFDSRVRVMGDFTATGGTITTSTYQFGNNLYLNGASNTISGQVVFQNNIGILLTTTGSQTLTGGASFHRLAVSGTGTKTIGVAQVNLLEYTPGNANSTLKLDQDMTVATTFSASTASAGQRTYIIDTNQHTLDASQATFTLGGSTGNELNATWNLAGDGTLKAKSFNLATGKATNVTGATTLVATAAGSANNLGNPDPAGSPTAGTISASSTFIYAAGSGSAASTLESNRALGHLRVDSGTLALAGSADLTATSVTVKAGAMLDASARAFTTTSHSLTLGVTGAAIGQILANGTFDAVGTTLTLDFGATPAALGDHRFFGDNATLAGAFDSIVLSGLYNDFSLTAANAWTSAAGGLVFTFNIADGSLNVSSSTIPEPGALAALAGLGVLCIAALRRRRIGFR